MRFFSLFRRARPQAAAAPRWQTPGEFDPAWKARIARMAALIDVPGVVADFGCGMMWLEAMLPPRNKYLPIDSIRRDERTIVLDLNTDPLTTIRGDVAFLSGVLEYIHDVPAFIERLGACGFTQVIASYCTLDDHPDQRERDALGWKSHLSLYALLEGALRHHVLTAIDRTAGDTIIALTRRTR